MGQAAVSGYPVRASASGQEVAANMLVDAVAGNLCRQGEKEPGLQFARMKLNRLRREPPPSYRCPFGLRSRKVPCS